MKMKALTILTAATMFSSAALADTSMAKVTSSAQLAANASLEIAQNRTYLDVVNELKAEGYLIRNMTKTWLGRIKIVAQSAANLREVVVSQTTGEVMSDVIIEIFATSDGAATGSISTAGDGIGIDVGAGAGTGTDTGTDTDTDVDADSGASIGVTVDADTQVDLGISVGNKQVGGSVSNGVSVGLGN